MTVKEIRDRQTAAMPKEDLSRYAGQWVALRDGHVIASDLDPIALRDKPEVDEDDQLVPVPAHGSGLLLL